MAGIFDENKMLQALGTYIPEGETLIAGIHCACNKMEIIRLFKNCNCTEDMFIPNENGAAFQLRKAKYAGFDVYLGITENYLIVAECEKYMHYYEVDEIADFRINKAEEVKTCILFEDIGNNCVPLNDIQICEIKKIWLGAYKCTITFKDGGFYKLVLPVTFRIS